MAYNDFRKSFYDRYGRYPNFTEGIAYETMMILFKAFESVDALEPLLVKEMIFKIREFDGLQGKITINQYGGTYREVNIFQIKDAEFVRADQQ